MKDTNEADKHDDSPSQKSASMNVPTIISYVFLIVATLYLAIAVAIEFLEKHPENYFQLGGIASMAVVVVCDCIGIILGWIGHAKEQQAAKEEIDQLRTSLADTAEQAKRADTNASASKHRFDSMGTIGL
jgi:hypothetical protein